MKRRAPAYTQKRRSQDAQRATLTQILTYAADLSRKTPADLARATGLSEAECQAALERERMFREARRA